MKSLIASVLTFGLALFATLPSLNAEGLHERVSRDLPESLRAELSEELAGPLVVNNLPEDQTLIVESDRLHVIILSNAGELVWHGIPVEKIPGSGGVPIIVNAGLAGDGRVAFDFAHLGFGYFNPKDYTFEWWGAD